jgi:hypothetical protein
LNESSKYSPIVLNKQWNESNIIEEVEERVNRQFIEQSIRWFPFDWSPFRADRETVHNKAILFGNNPILKKVIFVEMKLNFDAKRF